MTAERSSRCRSRAVCGMPVLVPDLVIGLGVRPIRLDSRQMLPAVRATAADSGTHTAEARDRVTSVPRLKEKLSGDTAHGKKLREHSGCG